MNSSKGVSCTTSYRDKYIPPYERLLRRNRSWKPKKVKEEEESKRKCREGKLTPFQQPENYSNYFINRQTTIFILDELIDQAKLTNYFSMDTEGDALTKKPATIQVEFIRHPTPPIIIIIEANLRSTRHHSRRYNNYVQSSLHPIVQFIHGDRQRKNWNDSLNLIYLMIQYESLSEIYSGNIIQFKNVD